MFTSNTTTKISLFSSLSNRKLFDQFEVNAIKNALLIIPTMFKNLIIGNQAPENIKKIFSFNN